MLYLSQVLKLPILNDMKLPLDCHEIVLVAQHEKKKKKGTT
jgi:hypothetical protein